MGFGPPGPIYSSGRRAATRLKPCTCARKLSSAAWLGAGRFWGARGSVAWLFGGRVGTTPSVFRWPPRLSEREFRPVACLLQEPCPVSSCPAGAVGAGASHFGSHWDPPVGFSGPGFRA